MTVEVKGLKTNDRDKKIAYDKFSKKPSNTKLFKNRCYQTRGVLEKP